MGPYFCDQTKTVHPWHVHVRQDHLVWFFTFER
jgi:hypothetical protein